MDAVVMECNGKQAVVLKRDGTFMTVPNRQYQVGEKIEISVRKTAWKKQLLAAACLILVLGLGTGLWCTPYSYVNMDSGYSVEYTLNRFEYVIRINVSSDDRRILTQEFLNSVKNTKVEKAVSATMGLFDDKRDVSIRVSSRGQDEETRIQENLKADEQIISRKEHVTVESGENNRIEMQASRMEMQLPEDEELEADTQKEQIGTDIIIEETTNEASESDMQEDDKAEDDGVVDAAAEAIGTAGEATVVSRPAEELTNELQQAEQGSEQSEASAAEGDSSEVSVTEPGAAESSEAGVKLSQ